MDHPKCQNPAAKKANLTPFAKTKWQILLLFGIFLITITILISKEWIFAQSVSISAVVPDTSATPVPTPASAPTPAPSGGGGGGGGGSVAIKNIVTVSGRAYPLSKVTLLKDGQKAITTVAGPDANFEMSLTGLSAGQYTLAVYSEDKEGRRSSLFSFPVSVTKGAITRIGGIFLAPTITVDKKEVAPGDTVTFFGQSAPQAVVTITVNSVTRRFVKTETDESGVYLVQWDTSPLEIGKHMAQSKTTLKKEISPLSLPVEFEVTSTPETESELKSAAPFVASDLNQDNHVDLVDFSVLAYWYKRPLPPSDFDLNNDAKIDLVDFSIMAFYWSG